MRKPLHAPAGTSHRDVSTFNDGPWCMHGREHPAAVPVASADDSELAATARGTVTGHPAAPLEVAVIQSGPRAHAACLLHAHPAAAHPAFARHSALSDSSLPSSSESAYRPMRASNDSDSTRARFAIVLVLGDEPFYEHARSGQ